MPKETKPKKNSLWWRIFSLGFLVGCGLAALCFLPGNFFFGDSLIISNFPVINIILAPAQWLNLLVSPYSVEISVIIQVAIIFAIGITSAFIALLISLIAKRTYLSNLDLQSLAKSSEKKDFELGANKKTKDIEEKESFNNKLASQNLSSEGDAAEIFVDAAVKNLTNIVVNFRNWTKKIYSVKNSLEKLQDEEEIRQKAIKLDIFKQRLNRTHDNLCKAFEKKCDDAKNYLLIDLYRATVSHLIELYNDSKNPQAKDFFSNDENLLFKQFIDPEYYHHYYLERSKKLNKVKQIFVRDVELITYFCKEVSYFVKKVLKSNQYKKNFHLQPEYLQAKTKEKFYTRQLTSQKNDESRLLKQVNSQNQNEKQKQASINNQKNLKLVQKKIKQTMAEIVKIKNKLEKIEKNPVPDKLTKKIEQKKKVLTKAYEKIILIYQPNSNLNNEASAYFCKIINSLNDTMLMAIATLDLLASNIEEKFSIQDSLSKQINQLNQTYGNSEWLFTELSSLDFNQETAIFSFLKDNSKDNKIDSSILFSSLFTDLPCMALIPHVPEFSTLPPMLDFSNTSPNNLPLQDVKDNNESMHSQLSAIF